MPGAILKFVDVQAGEMNSPLIKVEDWQVRKGEHWILTGPNGAGKTILAKAIAGRARVFTGHISSPTSPDNDDVRGKTGLVSFTDPGKLFRSVNADHYYQQRYNAFDADGHLTVRAYLRDGGLDEKNTQHNQLLEQLQLGPILDRERIKLSSGQTRKLMLCKALLPNPTLLVLDDPHIGLDGESREKLNAVLDQLVERTTTTLIMSGHFATLPQCITHEIKLDRGKTTYIGTFTSEDTPAFKSANKKLPSRLIECYQNIFIPDRFTSILSFTNIGVQYGSHQLIKDFSWEVKQGDKWTITGSNGAGKSTLLSLIYGDHPQAYANNIELFGKPRGGGESIWDIKKRIGFSSAELHAYFRYDFPARDVVLSGLWDGYFVKEPDKKSIELMNLLFEYYQLKDKTQAPFHSLSTGIQRILFFLRALIKAPSLLLLDEPFQGLDSENIALSKQLLDEILPELSTLIFISHFKSEIPLTAEKHMIL